MVMSNLLRDFILLSNGVIIFLIGKILNIYSRVNITASGQHFGYSSIWKPIDGLYSPAVQSSWRSLRSSNSWWRMELPHRIGISKVIIYTPERTSTITGQMNGFAVYIGDSSVGNGSHNAMCGRPWVASTTSVITINCTYTPIGKYMYVAGADRSGAQLYLSEISVYECEGEHFYVSVIYL